MIFAAARLGDQPSNIRGSAEHLSQGRFTRAALCRSMAAPMRGAGTIKSGGQDAARGQEVVLDIDQPGAEDFIWCKAHEEEKAGALRATAGFDMSIDVTGSSRSSTENAQHSVRVHRRVS